MEEEIADPSAYRINRRSFQLLLGLASGDSIPDETTICRYRELFARHGLDQKLFKTFNQELQRSGLLLEKGTLIDATIKEEYVIADKGYANEKRKARLRRDGVYCGILDKGYRNRPLSHKQKARNKKLSAVRNALERPFAYAKQVQNYTRCSYYTLKRNRFQFNLVALVYNIRRFITLSCSPA